MTAEQTFRLQDGKSIPIALGPPKFELMLALFDGNHCTTNPRLVQFGLHDNGLQYTYAIINSVATDGIDGWIIEGTKGYRGMMGLVKEESFIARYSTRKKKGELKYISKI